jgi:hypothetical protein
MRVHEQNTGWWGFSSQGHAGDLHRMTRSMAVECNSNDTSGESFGDVLGV